MDKYKLAIIEHERCRTEIISLTELIGNAANTFPEQGDSGGKCLDYQGGFPDTTTCIERYWQDNREWKESLELEEADLIDYEQRTIVPLCPSCSEVDKLVNERKLVKQNFGVAKRRIGQLARGLNQL